MNLIQMDILISQVVNFGTNLDVLIKVADQSGNSSIGESIFNILNNQEIPLNLKELNLLVLKLVTN